MASRRLDTPPSVAGMYLRVLCTQCGGRGCLLCNNGFTWVSVYAQGRGEQGDDFADLREREAFEKARATDPLAEAGHS